MLRAFLHGLENAFDEPSWDFVMKQIRHRVHEDPTTAPPSSRFIQSRLIDVYPARPYRAFAALTGGTGVFRVAHCLEPGGHTHGVAIRASCRRHRAPGDRVPREVSPFNSRRARHYLSTAAAKRFARSLARSEGLAQANTSENS